jgi:hypothetical protein
LADKLSSGPVVLLCPLPPKLSEPQRPRTEEFEGVEAIDAVILGKVAVLYVGVVEAPNENQDSRAVDLGKS